MLCGNFVRFSCLLIAFVVPSFSFIHDVPGIWPAVLSPNVWDVAGQAHFLKKRPSDFVHPGIWHTHEDLERIRRNVRAGKEPWASAYAEFKEDQFSLSNYTMQGPYPVLERGLISNYSSFTSDVRAAWQNALMWYITKDDAHYKVCTGILDAWGSNLTNIIGTDRSLMIGLEGDLFVNAAEIMRWEAGWKEAGAAWQGGSGFSLQLYFLFSRQSAVVGQANYGMISIKSMLSFAVYLDDVALYNYAMSLYINDPCAGVPATYEPKTGQSSESGRDQGTVALHIHTLCRHSKPPFRTRTVGNRVGGTGRPCRSISRIRSIRPSQQPLAQGCRIHGQVQSESFRAIRSLLVPLRGGAC